MIGFGTVLNVGGILAGGLLGLTFGNRLNKRCQDTLMSANALCVLFLGIGGCMEEMLKITENGLSGSGTMMMIGCFALGALIGEWLDLDRHMEEFGIWLKEKTKSEGDTSFVDGFVTASLTVCRCGLHKRRAFRRLLDPGGEVCAGPDYRHDHGRIHGKGLHLFRDPGRDFPGGHHAAGPARGAAYDRGRPLQHVPDRLDADLLRGRQPDLGQKNQGRQSAADDLSRGGMGVPSTVSLWIFATNFIYRRHYDTVLQQHLQILWKR